MSTVLVLLLIVLAAVVLVLLYGVKIYNDLVRNRQMVKEGWSGIDVQLKRRAGLIPNMIAAVRGYMTHERETLDEVTRLRARAQGIGEARPAERAQVEGMLGASLGRLMAVAENYPDLKANQNFLELQLALQKIEDQIQLARRYYNGAVRQLNTYVEQFPSNIVAGMFGFESAEFFEIDDAADRAVPSVSFDKA